MAFFHRTPKWRVVVEGKPPDRKNLKGEIDFFAVETHTFVVEGSNNAAVVAAAEQACRNHGQEPLRIVKILEMD